MQVSKHMFGVELRDSARDKLSERRSVRGIGQCHWQRKTRELDVCLRHSERQHTPNHSATRCQISYPGAGSVKRCPYPIAIGVSHDAIHFVYPCSSGNDCGCIKRGDQWFPGLSQVLHHSAPEATTHEVIEQTH